MGFFTFLVTKYLRSVPILLKSFQQPLFKHSTSSMASQKFLKRTCETAYPTKLKKYSNFTAAHRKIYSSNHVIIRLVENWKKHLCNKKIVRTVLMDLSKAFDCIPQDLLIAELHVYSFNKKASVSLYPYLKRRKQSAQINETESFFQILLPGVPQESILEPNLFNLFINDLFFF